MSNYLKSEARWARQQAIEAQRKVDALRNEQQVERDRKEAARAFARAKWDARVAVANARERLARLNPDRLPETIAAEEATIARWVALADEYEARIVETEQAGLFAEEPA